MVRPVRDKNSLDQGCSGEGCENWSGVEYILKVDPIGFAA